MSSWRSCVAVDWSSLLERERQQPFRPLVSRIRLLAYVIVYIGELRGTVYVDDAANALK